MIFSEFPIFEAEDAILAHTTSGDGWTLKKGRCLSKDDCLLLAEAGIQQVRAAKLEDGDVREDDAAKAVAEGVSGEQVSSTAAHTGRCNLTADVDGVVRIEVDTVNRLNAIDESITVATLPDFARVAAGQTIATIKIIPFAVEESTLAVIIQAVSEGSSPITVAPFQPLSVILINTTLPALKDSVVEKTTVLTKRRLEVLGGVTNEVLTCRHAESDVADSIREAAQRHPGLIIVVGASVTVDRLDVVPAGIVKAGGEIEHFGMPVDPGNLMLLARCDGIPVLVLPGCARSPKLNGIDWVLERFASRLPITRDVISGLGVGGLMVDSPVRPMPRDQAVREMADVRSEYSIAAVILAAGQSRRMGQVNKLLEPINDIPLIRHTVETVLASKAESVVVVTGHHASDVEKALYGLNVLFAYNPDFDDGLSTSLGAGLAAVPGSCDGAIVCLGDMPGIQPGHVDALIELFDPEAGRSIGVPVHLGKRGNPIVWARHFFDVMTDVSGDVGARHLIGANADLVYEVEFEDTAVLTDLDTPEQWARFRETEAV